MKSIVLSFCFLLIAFCAFAQDLVFKNTNGKTIQLKNGDQLSIFYKGYLGQKQYSNQDFLFKTDSSIVVGVAAKPINPKVADYLLMKGQLQKEILFKDIIAFRRISVGRKLLKSTLNIAAITGFAFLLSENYGKEKTSFGQSFLYSLAGGISISLLINLALPENPKYKMEDGWQVQP
jgi:hypothetical protein